MKILDLEQRSQEWLDFHEGRISGSSAKDYSSVRYIPKAELVEFAESKGYEFPKNLTMDNIRAMLTEDELNELYANVQINDSIYKLIAQRIAKPINPNDYADRIPEGATYSAMLRGQILEEEARELISEKLGKKIIPGRVWQSEENEYMICSPDGEFEDETEAVEIKCLDSWKVVKAYYEKHPPLDYEAQIIQYFLVNENLQKLYFCIYSDVFTNPDLGLQIFELKREDYREKIELTGRVQNATLGLVEREVQKLMF
ncbi:YqaJ viral recombinase family protein [Prevotella pallens]|uniref:YqaJ viral recombinase family protein n=1 Tax=Prevotella pallens TaxID=60133 RepID=UPI001CADB32B|nr:YqaJ viral recombinase family protein [Prevotella pallens]MBF1483048.1 YqaJ viral recombinase family protein [Prevotella pallens]